MPAKPRPKPAFPDPAAVLPGEADILAAVIADPADLAAKLVYADWLEDQGDPRGPLLRDFVSAYRTGRKLPAARSVPQPWRDLVGISLVEKLRGTDLAAKADRVLALAKPAISYATVRASEKAVPVGASKFGGGPDLPPGAEWPTFEDEPLSFLGQFNLAELQASPVACELPAAGLLSAFCLYRGDGDDDFPAGSWRLLHFPDTAGLVRRPPPGAPFPSCRVEFTECLTLPHRDSPWTNELRAVGEMKYGSTYSNVYYDLHAGDHLLGHLHPIQCDLLGRKSVRHLLTIGGNETTGWEFGDGGALYFMLSEADLKAGRFDRVRMVMDCG